MKETEEKRGSKNEFNVNPMQKRNLFKRVMSVVKQDYLI